MKDLKFLEKNVIAHRGYYNNEEGIVENTLKAFERAIEKGYPIELDVRILKDNTIVVYHDKNIIRLTNKSRKIKDLTREDLKDIKLLHTDLTIPTFEETLKFVNGRTPLLIEIKNGLKIGKLEKNLSKLLENYKGEFAIQSFNSFSLLWFEINKPEVIRGQLASGFTSIISKPFEKLVMKNMLLNWITHPDFISYDVHDITEEKVLKIKSKKPILGWTISNKEDYEKYKDTYSNLICEKFI